MPDDRDWMNALFAKPSHRSLVSPFTASPPRGNALTEIFLPGSFGNALASAPPAANWLKALARPAPPPRSLQPITLGGLLAPTQKRMVYFSFAFADQMRVNNVRQFRKIGPRESRNARHFRDRSIWESRDIKTVEGLKDLMRDAMKQSSVVCVLVGSTAYNSRWAKYEIARAIVDRKGLLAVHINGHQSSPAEGSGRARHQSPAYDGHLPITERYPLPG